MATIVVLLVSLFQQTLLCATPRPDDPLLQDAVKLATGSDASTWGINRTVFGVYPVSADMVLFVQDEATCRRAATAYVEALRRAAPTRFAERPVTPVLVVQVDQVYLVDDLRSRSGPDAHWEVMVFDTEWRQRGSYGGGG